MVAISSSKWNYYNPLLNPVYPSCPEFLFLYFTDLKTGMFLRRILEEHHILNLPIEKKPVATVNVATERNFANNNQVSDIVNHGFLNTLFVLRWNSWIIILTHMLIPTTFVFYFRCCNQRHMFCKILQFCTAADCGSVSSYGVIGLGSIG